MYLELKKKVANFILKVANRSRSRHHRFLFSSVGINCYGWELWDLHSNCLPNDGFDMSYDNDFV